MPTIGLLVGSFRHRANSIGISSWLDYYIKKVIPNATVKKYNPISPINIMPEPIDPVSPMMIKSPDDYVNPVIRKWGHAVAECDGYVILSPEYNHYMSGHLKVMFDHIYNEFKGKPAVLVTFSGHGGEAAYHALEELVHKFGIGSLSGLHFALPMSYVAAKNRVAVEFDPEKKEEDAFLKELGADLETEITRMKDSLDK